MSQQGKIAIVTGGSTGIGRATAALLRARGTEVYNLDIAHDGTSDGSFIACDVSDHASVSSAVNAVAAANEGRIDVLFANVGLHLFADLEETTAEDFERVVGVNLKGAFFTLKAVLPIMRKQGHGVVLMMGSDQSLVGKGRSSVYGLTKGAIGQLTRSTAIDYAPHGTRVNCLCAGTTDTPLLNGAIERYHSLSGIPCQAIRESLDAAQPIRRVATAEEIAKVAAFLLSEDSSYMTGALVAADGGYTAQ